MKRTLLILLTVFLSIPAFSQSEMTLYNMPSIGQSSRVNPSLLPVNRYYIGLPGISSTSVQFSNRFVFHDFYQKLGNDSVQLNIDNAISQLGKNNLFSLALTTDILSCGVTVKNNYLTFNVSERLRFDFTYAKEFLQLINEGNGPFIGKRLDFSKTGFNATHYREYGLGYARQANEQWTFGGRFKYLYGMENFSSVSKNLGLYTAEEDYSLEIPTDIVINTSSPVNSSNGYGNMNVQEYLFKKKNTGYAIDLGASFKLNDRISFSTSIVDFGYIHWRSDVKNYKTAAGSYHFGGIDLKEFLSESDSGSQSALDSLSETFRTVESNDGYTTKLPTQLYLGMNYGISKKTFAGILLHGEYVNKVFQPSAMLSYNIRVGRHFALSVNGSFMNQHLNNVGAGIAVNSGPIQLYMVSDNGLGVLHPLDYHTTHVHAGMNLIFGRKPVHGNNSVRGGSKGHSSGHSTAKAKSNETKAPPSDRDGDGVADAIDFCPDIPGLAMFDGCPDRDNDGVQDLFDNCPDEFGVPAFNGCPDSDGDGVMDKRDNCPTVPGPVSNKGCPTQ